MHQLPGTDLEVPSDKLWSRRAIETKLSVSGETAHGERSLGAGRLELHQMFEEGIGRKGEHLSRASIHPMQIVQRDVDGADARILHQVGCLQSVQECVLREWTSGAGSVRSSRRRGSGE